MTDWPAADDAAVYLPPPLEPTPSEPADRRIEIALARLREGLPISDELLNESLLTGDWLTAGERAEVYGDLGARAQTILAGAEDVLGGIEMCWLDGRRGVRVQLTDRLEHYDRQLRDALGPERVVVERARFSERELDDLHALVREQDDALAQLGIRMIQSGPRAGELWISYCAADQARAERILQERFGEFARFEYRGASLRRLCPQEFGSWLAEGSLLHVFYGLGHNGERPGNCVCSESETEVLVDLTILDWRGAKTLIGGFIPSHATVELSRPLEERVVIDNAANRARPHWTRVPRRSGPGLR